MWRVVRRWTSSRNVFILNGFNSDSSAMECSASVARFESAEISNTGTCWYFSFDLINLQISNPLNPERFLSRINKSGGSTCWSFIANALLNTVILWFSTSNRSYKAARSSASSSTRIICFIKFDLLVTCVQAESSQVCFQRFQIRYKQ